MEHRLETLYDGGLYLEGPRWHAGRLWCVDSLKRKVLAVDMAGNAEIVCDIRGVAGGTGFLPSGELIVTSMFARNLLKFGGGELSRFIDLSRTAAGTIDDMIIDGMGRIYVGDLGFDLAGAAPVRRDCGRLIVAASDGSAKVVAEGLHFPNGIAVSGDGKRLIVAESDGNCLARFNVNPDGTLKFQERFGDFREPDGICMDSESAIWVSLYQEDSFVRVDLGGKILDHIPVDGRRAVACALGGADRRTLFCISADTTHEKLMQGASKARIDFIEVATPGDGYP